MHSSRHWIVFGLLVLVVLLGTACGGDDDDVGGDTTPSATGMPTSTPSPTATPTSTPTATATPTEAPAPEFGISSAAFDEGQPIPVRYSCDGLNVSPPFEIEGVPDGAVTLALVFDDPDAPGDTFDHWVLFNMPITAEIAEGAGSASGVASSLGTPGLNSFGNTAYGGPCPPSGSHQYVVTLYAVDSALGLAEGAPKEELEAALEGHIVGETQLTGTYDRAQARRPPAPGFPETTVTANLSIGYKVDSDGQPLAFDPEELPAPLASVQAQWYRSGGSWVLVYLDLSLNETGPICPGNSIQTAAGFQHLSNSPTVEGACQGQDVLGPPVGLRACGDLVVYVTAIPTTSVGNLYGTIARFEADGNITGLTSVTPADAGAAPEIDLDALCG